MQAYELLNNQINWVIPICSGLIILSIGKIFITNKKDQSKLFESSWQMENKGMASVIFVFYDNGRDLGRIYAIAKMTKEGDPEFTTSQGIPAKDRGLFYTQGHYTAEFETGSYKNEKIDYNILQSDIGQELWIKVDLQKR